MSLTSIYYIHACVWYYSSFLVFCDLIHFYVSSCILVLSYLHVYTVFFLHILYAVVFITLWICGMKIKYKIQIQKYVSKGHAVTPV
jgi:hypothetical protein